MYTKRYIQEVYKDHNREGDFWLSSCSSGTCFFLVDKLKDPEVSRYKQGSEWQGCGYTKLWIIIIWSIPKIGIKFSHHFGNRITMGYNRNMLLAFLVISCFPL